MPAAPLGGTQSSIPCACPEVIQFMLHLNEELLDDISFQAQDVWSLGCLLVWLVTGDLPFLCFLEELEICKISQLECMCLKHAAWVSSPTGSLLSLAILHKSCSFCLPSCLPLCSHNENC